MEGNGRRRDGTGKGRGGGGGGGRAARPIPGHDNRNKFGTHDNTPTEGETRNIINEKEDAPSLVSVPLVSQLATAAAAAEAGRWRTSLTVLHAASHPTTPIDTGDAHTHTHQKEGMKLKSNREKYHINYIKRKLHGTQTFVSLGSSTESTALPTSLDQDTPSAAFV